MIVTNQHDFFRWLKAFSADPEATSGQKLVGQRVGLHLNLDPEDAYYGRCNPGAQTIADETGMSERGVQKALYGAIALGWLVVSEPGGDGAENTNQYGLLMQNVDRIEKILAEKKKARDDARRKRHGSTNHGSYLDRRAQQPRANSGTEKHELSSTEVRTDVHPISKRTSKRVSNVDDVDADGDARKRATPALNNPPAAAKALTEELLVIARYGSKSKPPGWHDAPQRVADWLSRGWHRDAILAGADLAMSRKRDGPPYSVQYFEPEIAKQVAVLAEPLPITPAAPAPRHRLLRGHDATLAYATRKAQQLYEAGLREEDLDVTPAAQAPPSKQLRVTPAAPAARRFAPPPASPKPPPPPQRPPRPDPKRGQYEMEIRATIGDDRFDDLPEHLIAHLCTFWAHRRLTAAEIEKIVQPHLKARSPGPPLKKTSSA